MNIQTFKKLWKDYLSGKMVLLGGFGLLASEIANSLELTIVSAVYVGSGAIVFQLEKIREEVKSDE